MPTKAQLQAEIAELKQELAQQIGEVERLRQQVILDELTGLYSRRYLNDRLEAEESDALRMIRDGKNPHLFIIFADIDHFKHVNDTLGHLIGNHVLQLVAQAIKRHLRRNDTAGRWGGEEILVVGRGNGMVVANRLREEVAAARFGVHAVTVSCGVAVFNPEIDDSINETIRRADHAMYAAKDAGRNCCHLAAMRALPLTL